MEVLAHDLGIIFGIATVCLTISMIFSFIVFDNKSFKSTLITAGLAIYWYVFFIINIIVGGMNK